MIFTNIDYYAVSDFIASVSPFAYTNIKSSWKFMPKYRHLPTSMQSPVTISSSAKRQSNSVSLVDREVPVFICLLVIPIG